MLNGFRALIIWPGRLGLWIIRPGRRCQKISKEEYATMQDVNWICTYCNNPQILGRYEEMKLFKMYVDDIICTVRGDPDEYLKFTNSLHNNLQFTLEKVNMEGNLAFHQINVNVSSKSNITCHWYQKPTETEIILNFRSCAPLQHNKNVIQGTVHRFLMQLLIGWPSIRLLKGTKLAGPKINIQKIALQK